MWRYAGQTSWLMGDIINRRRACNGGSQPAWTLSMKPVLKAEEMYHLCNEEKADSREISVESCGSQ